MGTSLRRRRPSVCAAAAAAALALTACLPGGGGSAESSGAGSASSSSSGGGEGSPAPYEAEESLDEPRQRELTADRAKKALPTDEDMPEETYGRDVSEQTSERRTYEPSRCAAVELASENALSFREKHRTTYEYARFRQSQVDGGKFLGVWISSHDEPYPLAYFDAAGESLSDCPTFTETTPRGTTFTSTTEAIPAPHVDGAERVFAVRILGAGRSTDRLYVRSGHNLVLVMQQTATKDPFDERLLTQHAQAVLDHLEQNS